MELKKTSKWLAVYRYARGFKQPTDICELRRGVIAGIIYALLSPIVLILNPFVDWFRYVHGIVKVVINVLIVILYISAVALVAASHYPESSVLIIDVWMWFAAIFVWPILGGIVFGVVAVVILLVELYENIKDKSDTILTANKLYKSWKEKYCEKITYID